MKVNVPRRIEMKYVVRTLGVLLLGAILAGCSSEFENQELDVQALSIQDVKKLKDGKTFSQPPADGKNYNCVTTDFDVPGQGARALGSTGGLGYTLPTNTATTTASAIGTGLKTSFFSGYGAPTVSSNSQEERRILILDDFGSGTGQFTLPSVLFAGSNIQTLIDNGSLTHGALVMHHALNVLDGSNLFTQISSTTSEKVYKRDTTTLRVKAVNMYQSQTFAQTTRPRTTTDHIAGVLRSALDKYDVVNMSFVIIPCDVYEDFLHSQQYPYFVDYIEKLASFNGFTTNTNQTIDVSGSSSQGERNLVTAIIKATNNPNDALRKLIDLNKGKHIFVAASGNYGFTYGMYPANWPGVVNVTGSRIENANNRATDLFNAGEVMSTGSMFELKPTSGKSVYYYGTSYAAPSVSVYSVLDWALTNRCSDTTQGLKSELALDGGGYSLTDTRLESVVPTRCGAN
jgi:hypothetical protein